MTTALATVAAAVVTGFFAWYVQAWRFRREANSEAIRVLRRNRDPLLRAAFDLQSRLYNIVAGNFLDRYWFRGNSEEKAYAIRSTLWLIGQYLGWVEVLRRDVQYLDLGSRRVNQRLQSRLSEISAALASDAGWLGDAFITFRTDQRAIGEFMVTARDTVDGGTRPDCLGYSEFVERLYGSSAAGNVPRKARFWRRPWMPAQSGDRETPVGMPVSPFAAWAARFSRELEKVAARGPTGMLSQPRLITAQRRLIDLVDLLDADRVRYPAVDVRGKLPAVSAEAAERRDRIATFVWPFSDPWETVDEWARSDLTWEVSPDGGRRYVGRWHLTGWRSEFRIRRGGQLEVDAWVSRAGGRKPRSLDGSLRSRRARRVANELLAAFDRPLVAGGATKPDRLIERLANHPRH